MSMEGLIALVVMLIIGLVGIGVPFLTTKSTVTSNRKRQLELSRDELLASYERVLATLRDLEDDFKSHKMNEDEYERERDYWKQYGIRLLQILEGQNPESVNDEMEIEEEMNLDRNVEEAIYNYRVALKSVEKS